MLGITKQDMNSLRIEEGKKMEIGQTGNPLDGTWTRPDPALKNLIFVNKAKQIWVLFLYMFMFSVFVVIIEIRIFAFVLLTALMVACFGAIIYAYWAAQLTYNNHRFRITDEELIVEDGIISLNKTLVPLTSIYDVTTTEGYWHRKYGIKSVLAGPCELMGLKNGDEVAEAILSRVKQAKNRMRVDE